MVKENLLDENTISKVRNAIKSKYKILSKYDIEDIMQASVLNLIQKYPNVSNRKEVCSLLYTIAKNISITTIRKNKRSVPFVVECSGVEDKHEIDCKKMLISQIQTLPQKYMQAIKLYYLEEKKYREVAHELGINENTAKTWVRRGLEKLRVKINK